MVHVSAASRQRTLQTLGLYESGLSSGLSPFTTPASSRQLSVFTSSPCSSKAGVLTPSPCSPDNGGFTPSACSSEDGDGGNSRTPTQKHRKQLNDKLERLAIHNKQLSKEITEITENKKQKKEQRNVDKQAKARVALVTEVLRLATAVLTPLPEGSLARFAIMIAETYMVIRRNTME